jgi:hypothetical protein
MHSIIYLVGLVVIVLLVLSLLGLHQTSFGGDP